MAKCDLCEAEAPFTLLDHCTGVVRRACYKHHPADPRPTGFTHHWARMGVAEDQLLQALNWKPHQLFRVKHGFPMVTPLDIAHVWSAARQVSGGRDF